MKSFRDQLMDGTNIYEKEALQDALKLLDDVIAKSKRYATLVNQQGSAPAIMNDGVFIGKIGVAADIIRHELSLLRKT